MRWFISDTHFGHAKIIEYSSRPFQNVEEMNEKIIENWNKCIQDDDEVYFLGDFGLNSIDYLKEIGARLKGKKIATIGNHDSRNRLLACGFIFVVNSLSIHLIGHEVTLAHIPTEGNPGTLFLHGHIHYPYVCPNYFVDNKLNLNCEYWNYSPVHENQIIKLMRETPLVKYGKN